MVVQVAGAGLSGLVAAITVARLGESVEVYDVKKRLLPSSGPHTEGLRNYLARDALEELQSYGFDFPPFATVTTTIRRSPNHENILRGPAYYLFLRGRAPESLDHELYREALDLGVEFRFGAEAPRDADIVATGPPKGLANILGAGFTFSADGADLDPTTVYALLDNRAAPGGYLVITPGIEFHSIYSVAWSLLDYSRLLAMFQRAIQIPWIRRVLGTSRRISAIHGRAYYSEDPVSGAIRGNCLYAGEAGGFQDAIAGFGFRYAVITGCLAGRVAVEKGDYRAMLRQGFGEEFAEAYRYRSKLDRATNEDFDILVRALGPETSLEQHRVLRHEVRLI